MQYNPSDYLLNPMTKNVPLLLHDNECFNPPLDVSIEVVKGHLWLTYLGCYSDILLTKGQKTRISAAHGALLQALGQTEVRLEIPPKNPNFWRALYSF